MSAPTLGARVQIIAGRTPRRSVEIALAGGFRSTGTIMVIAVGEEEDIYYTRIDTTKSVLRLYRSEFRVVPPEQ